MINKSRAYRLIVNILLISIIVFLSHFFVTITSIGDSDILKSSALFAYFGVLTGFSLTIYTFGISISLDIRRKIEEDSRFDGEKKEKLCLNLIRGFSEIKQDIWFIFISIIMVIFFSLLEKIPQLSCFNVKINKIPETANLSLFVIATFLMYDIMKTLFNVSEARLELILSKPVRRDDIKASSTGGGS